MVKTTLAEYLERTTTLIRIRSSYLVVALILGPIAVNWPQVEKGLEFASQQSVQQMEMNRSSQAGRRTVRTLSAQSDLAMDRVRTACIVVVDEGTGDPSFLREGQRTTLSVPPHSLVCNALGDTAQVRADGTLENLARVSPADRQEYLHLLDQQPNGGATK